MRFTQSTLIIRLLLFIGIFIMLNVLVYSYFFRLDFTADKRYTLSQSTLDILVDLEEPITVTAYFTEDLPASLSILKDDFRDLLYEYQTKSDGQLVFEFISPNEDEAKKQEAEQQGIAPLLLQTRENDKASELRAYLGAIIKKGTQQEVIPVVQPGASMEYELTKSIKRLTVIDKPKVGVIRGHGEPDIRSIAPVLQELSTLYELDTLNLNVPNAWAEFKTLVLLAPSDSIPQYHFAQLDQFLASGGRLLAGVNAVQGDLNRGMLSELTTGLESWLNAKGFVITPVFVTDVLSGQVQARQQTPLGIMSVPIDFYYFPTITNFPEHPISEGIESVTMIFASPVEVIPKDSSVRGGILAATSARSGKISPPSMLDLQKQWTEADFPEQNIPVAAYLEGKIQGETESKIVVIGDGDFAVQGSQAENNLNFIVNAVDWLTDDTGLIELRTKGINSRPIEKQLTDGERATMKYLLFFLPILIIIGVGVVRMQIRKSQRVKWMQEDFSA
ncbi:MAG: Gldg family protein [Bacteroidota bacterium]